MVKIALGGIEIMQKILNSNFICIFKTIPGFFQEIFRFFPGLSLAWKFIFSFSRFSRVHGNSAIYYKTTNLNSQCHKLNLRHHRTLTKPHQNNPCFYRFQTIFFLGGEGQKSLREKTAAEGHPMLSCGKNQQYIVLSNKMNSGTIVFSENIENINLKSAK